MVKAQDIIGFLGVPGFGDTLKYVNEKANTHDHINEECLTRNNCQRTITRQI